MYAIPDAREGMPRQEAARLTGMEQQASRDAGTRYNAEGLAGLHDRPKEHPPFTLTEADAATFAAAIFRAPGPTKVGVCTWTRPALCRWLDEHFGKNLPSIQPHPCAAADVPVPAEGPAAPSHDRRQSAGVVQKRRLREALEASTSHHPTKSIQLWFQDEA